MKLKNEEYSSQETRQRVEAAVRGAFNASTKNEKTAVKKSNKARQRKTKRSSV